MLAARGEFVVTLRRRLLRPRLRRSRRSRCSTRATATVIVVGVEARRALTRGRGRGASSPRSSLRSCASASASGVRHARDEGDAPRAGRAAHSRGAGSDRISSTPSSCSGPNGPGSASPSSRVGSRSADHHARRSGGACPERSSAWSSSRLTLWRGGRSHRDARCSPAERGVCPPGPPAPGWVAVDGRHDRRRRGRARPRPGPSTRATRCSRRGSSTSRSTASATSTSPPPTRIGWLAPEGPNSSTASTAYCPTLVTRPSTTYPPRCDRVTRQAGRPQERSRSDDRRRAPRGPVPRRRARRASGRRSCGRPTRTGSPAARRRPRRRRGRRRSRPKPIPSFATIRCSRPGVVVALGHSTATYEEALAAVDAGARLVTHAVQRHGPVASPRARPRRRRARRRPADAHAHRRSRARASRRVAARDPQRSRTLALVTRRGGGRRRPRTRDTTRARLADGTLAGSTLSMDRAVRNVVGLGIPVERAVEMATTIPRPRSARRPRPARAGCRADLVALDPDTLAVRAVWLAGELAAQTRPADTCAT